MISFTGHTGSVRSVQYSPDGTLLASGGDDATVRLWSLVEQREVHCWENLDAGVEALAFVANGALLAAGFADGKVRVWNVATQKQLWKVPTNTSGVRALVASGKMLISANWNCELCVWDNAEKKHLGAIPHDRHDAITAMTLAPDGHTLAAAFNTPPTLALISDPKWSTMSMERLTVGAVYALAYAPDGDLALGGTHGMQTITPAGKTGPSFVGHRGTIYGVAFTPDGQRLISTGADATTRVWEVATGREMHVYQWHPRWATCLAVAPDGLTVATAGVDQTVVVWDMAE